MRTLHFSRLPDEKLITDLRNNFTSIMESPEMTILCRRPIVIIARRVNRVTPAGI